MATNRPTAPPKRSSAPARPTSHSNAWMPFALGFSFPLVAMMLDILGQGLPFSLASIITVQQAQPLHYLLLYLVPVVLLLLSLKKKSAAVRTPPISQQPGVRGSIASPAVNPPAQSQKAITTLQNELTSLKTQLDQTRARESALTTLIDNAKDAILTLNVDGTIASVNRGAEEMLGWTQQEMVGHPLSNLLALPSVPRFEEHLAHILSTPSALSLINLEFVHSDGTGLWAEGCNSVIRDAANQPTSFLVIYRNLRHRQQHPLGHDVELHPQLVSQQEDPQLWTDDEPRDFLASTSESTQSGAVKIPEFLTDSAPATDTLSTSEAAPTFAPLLEEIDPRGQARSSAPLQFALVDTQAESSSHATPTVPSQLSLDEQADADSQEASPPPLQFALVDTQAESSSHATPTVPSQLSLDEQADTNSQEVSPPPRQFTLADTQAGSESQLSPPTATHLSFADQPQPTIPSPSTAPFNFSEALSNIGGDENLLAELASIFLEEYPEILANVRTAVENNDGEALIYYAHALKGSVGNFVAVDTQNAARRLEQLGRDGDLANAPAVLSQLETALSRLTPALSDLAIQGAA